VVVALVALILLAIYQNFVRGMFVASFLAGMLALGGLAPADELNDALALIDAGDLRNAVPKLESLANQGNPTAQYRLAQAYYLGQGVPQDLQRAASLFESAAQMNVMNAQQNIAVMYLKGEGVKKDLERALYWFRQAASQGDSEHTQRIGIPASRVNPNYAQKYL
jgi:TPR repeat protein